MEKYWDLRSMTVEELEQQLTLDGHPKFRAKQIFDWVQKGEVSFDAMNNVPKALRVYLKERYRLDNVHVVKQLKSQKDGTQKFLFELHDHHVIEAVFMPYKHGNSICISTQVGCRMGCSFCASTKDGLVRNVTAGEMLGQIWAVQTATESKISNVVLMGSGEPLDNYEEVEKFLTLVNHERGLHIGMRHITLSTCGLVPEIDRLSELELQLTLAISLHAVTNELRSEMMPVNRKYPLEELLAACKRYVSKTNRRLTFEYALVEGVNDSVEQANALSQLLGTLLCHVNLIPVNPIEEETYQPSREKRVEMFKKTLEKNRINVTVRREMGRDINAACGQLRKSYMDEQKQ